MQAIERDVNAGTIIELAKAGEPASYLAIGDADLRAEIADLTSAVINTVKDNSFSHLKLYLSHICRLRMEQGTKLSDIMAVFDLYETALKDAMSDYLESELPLLNVFRRDIDSLLDRARVFVSEYFFLLYENTVFKQFEQLRIINEVSAHLASSLKLDQVLEFIVDNSLKLFEASCGSISLAGPTGDFSTRIALGWLEDASPSLIARDALRLPDITVADGKGAGAPYLQEVCKQENLSSLVLVKLRVNTRVNGLLAVGFRHKRQFAEPDQRVLITFANHAALAVNNAQLYGDTDQKLQLQIREANVLLEHNRAILQSMREGVVAIDAEGYITLINNEALRILGPRDDCIGKHISAVIPNSRLPHVVAANKAEYDEEQLLGDTSVITNRVPVVVNGEVTGAIATFRDKQDVKQLAEELIGVKNLLESMRAQSHEFMNKLHAISGLIQMKQYDKVVELINQIYKNKQELISFIVERIRDKATAGLLLGKVSQAEELGITLRITSRSRLAALPGHFGSAAVVTVLGNLITNAIEAVSNLPKERRLVTVHISAGPQYLSLIVSDKGNGIPRSCRRAIYRRGFSTKQGSRGLGLSLVRQEVEASGGLVSVRSTENEGSRFMVRIPL